MLASLITFLLVGLVALFVIGIVLAIVGAVFSAVLGLATFLLFKVVPIVLLGYLVVRFLAPREKRLERLEKKLLEAD
jgi:amino acid transporter